jgi:hypothetical protein
MCITLKVLNLLATKSADIVTPMAEMTLPSTLVKTLFLFFDLPVPTSAVRKVAWGRMHGRLTKLLAGLCSSPVVARELVKAEDLSRLFDMLYSEVPAHNAHWRDISGVALRSLFAKGLCDAAIMDIRATGCVPRSLAALRHVKGFSAATIADVLLTVITCVCESARLSHLLLDDFRTWHGYPFLTDFVLQFEKTWPNEELQLYTKVSSTVAKLVYCGLLTFKPSKDLEAHPFRDPGFKLPAPVAGTAICNLMGFEVLHRVFEQATSTNLRTGMATAIAAVFARDPVNYFIAQPKKTLEMMLRTPAELQVREQVFKIIEHVICTLKFVPLAELKAASEALETHDAVGECSHLALNAVIKFVNFNNKYGNVFREVGMLEVLIQRLIHRGNDLKEQHGSVGGMAFSEPIPLPRLQAKKPLDPELDESQIVDDDEDFYYGDAHGAQAEAATKTVVDRSEQGHVLLMECLSLLLTENIENADKFRAAGGARVLYSMVPIAQSRVHALRVVQQLVLDASHHAREDFSTLLELMQAAQPNHYAVKIDILKMCLRLFSLEPRTKGLFRDVQGFVYVISSLVALAEPSRSTRDRLEDGVGKVTKVDGLLLELVQKIFETLTAALCDSPANKHAMMHDIRYDILAESLQASGLVVSTASAQPTFHYLLTMACEGFGKQLDFESQSAVPLVVNPGVLKVAVTILHLTPLKVQQKMQQRLLRLTYRESNTQQMAEAGVAMSLLEYLKAVEPEIFAKVRPPAYQLIVQLCSHQLSSRELKAFMRLEGITEGSEPVSLEILNTLVAMESDRENHRGAPFVEFDMSEKGFGSLFFPSVARFPSRSAVDTRRPVRTWPPVSGLSVSMWFRVVQYGMDTHPVRLLTLFSPTEPEVVLFQLYIDPQEFNLILATAVSMRVPDVSFRPGQWTHIGIICSKPTRKGMAIRVYIDGAMRAELQSSAFTAGTSSATFGADMVCCRVGTCFRDRLKSTLAWRVGGMWIFEDEFSEQTMLAMHQLGPAYDGNFQGSLASYQPWCCSIAPRDLDSLQRGQLFTTGAGAGLLPEGMLDLRSVPVPLCSEQNLFASMTPNNTTLVSVDTALAAMGGRAASKLLARETRVLDQQTSVCAVGSWMSSGPALGFMGGAVRSFKPSMVAVTVEQIGGVAVIFRLISSATTAAYLKSAVELLVLVIKHSPRNVREMERVNGYAVLGMLLETKHALLNREILDLVISLTWLKTGTRDHVGNQGRRTSISNGKLERKKSSVSTIDLGNVSQPAITNAMAFRELLLNYDVWRSTSEGLLRLIFEHVGQLVAPEPRQATNIGILAELQFVGEYLAILQEEGTPASVAVEVTSVLSSVYAFNPTARYMKMLKWHLLSTLSPEGATAQAKEYIVGTEEPQRLKARNLLLKMIFNLLSTPNAGAAKNSIITGGVAESADTMGGLANAISETLGPTFFLLFLSRGIANSTVVVVLKILSCLLANPKSTYLAKFRAARGFEALAVLLQQHCQLDGIYYISLAMLHGQSVENLPNRLAFSMAGIETFFKGHTGGGSVLLPEMAAVLASLLSALHVQRADLPAAVVDLPAAVVPPPAAESSGNQYELVATAFGGRAARGDSVDVPPPYLEINQPDLSPNPFGAVDAPPAALVSGDDVLELGGSSIWELASSSTPAPENAPPPNPFAKPAYTEIAENSSRVVPPNPIGTAVPPNPFNTRTTPPLNPFAPKPEIASAPFNPFASKTPTAVAPPNPFLKTAATAPPSNPFSPQAQARATADNPFVRSPVSTLGATMAQDNAIRRSPANPFAGGASDVANASNLTGGGNPQWSSPWNAPSTNGGTTSPPDSPTRPAATAATNVSWHVGFATTLISYLVGMSEHSSAIREVLSSTKVLEALIRSLFVSGDLLTEQVGDRMGIVERQNIRGDEIVFRLCEPGGWPLRGKLRLNSLCKTSENVMRLASNVAVVVFQSAEPKNRAWTDRLNYFIEALLWAAPDAPEQDITEFSEVLSMQLLERCVESKAFARPSTVALQQLLHAVGVFAESIVQILCETTSWQQWHDRVFANIVTLLTQSVGAYGVKSSFVEAGGDTTSKGIAKLYAAFGRLVACKLAHSATAPESEMITSVNGVVDIRGVLFGKANTDSHVGLMVLRSLFMIAERAKTTTAPEFLHVLVILFREVHTHTPQLMASLPASYGRPTETTRLWEARDLEPFLAEGHKTTTIKQSAALDAAESKIAAAVATLRDRRKARLRNQTERDNDSAEMAITLGFHVSERVTEARRVERHSRESRVHKRSDHRRYITVEWKALNDGLFRERGIFGHAKDSPLCRWMVDEIEGPCRMRKKFRRNLGFFERYGGPDDEPVAKTPKNKRCPSSHLLPLFRKQSMDGVIPGLHQEQEQLNASLMIESPAVPDGAATTASTHDSPARPAANNSREDSSGGDVDISELVGINVDEPSADILALRLIEPGDTRQWEVEAESCDGLDTVDGVFFFCEFSAYFIAGCGLTDARNLYIRTDQVPNSSSGGSPRKRGGAAGGGGVVDEMATLGAEAVTKWRFEDIQDLRRRRHCLQDNAIELFSVDGATALISFPDVASRDKAYDAIIGVATTMSNSAEDSVDGMQRDAKLEKGGLLTGLLAAKTITQRWEAGEVSNFEYLMSLNTLAGRSYNDLNQYPVFPWILADYDSEELDLTNPATFRDLSKPMGALTPKRAEGYQMRYEMWEDPTGEGQPAFHYGTHYSSAQYVAGYLIRLEPFTQHFINLQGGHFDHPDRMFYSIPEQWKSASEVNSGDVKELTPEFFYLPDFLENANKFDFGVKSNGIIVDDVQLPKWAKGNAQEFIRLHRAALECDYVSAHLHEWVDLIFGYKQKGEDAIAAMNVFQHLTYEGAVDLDAIEDPMQRYGPLF